MHEIQPAHRRLAASWVLTTIELNFALGQRKILAHIACDAHGSLGICLLVPKIGEQVVPSDDNCVRERLMYSTTMEPYAACIGRAMCKDSARLHKA